MVPFTSEGGILIGDRGNDPVADRFARTLSGYRASGTEFALGRDIHNLVDSVHLPFSPQPSTTIGGCLHLVAAVSES